MKVTNSFQRRLTLVGFVVILLSAYVLLGGPAFAVSGVIEKTSANNFDQTVQKIKQGVTGNKLVLIKEINHQQMVKMVGVNAEQSMSLEIFHPRYGKQIHANDLSAFIAVPIRIMVQERSGKVMVGYQQPSALLAPYKGLDGLGKELDTLFASIVDGAVK